MVGARRGQRGAAPVSALAATDGWLFVASAAGLRWWDARTGAPVASFAVADRLQSLAVAAAGADSWVLAGATAPGAVVTLAYDAARGLERAEVRVQAAASGVAAGAPGGAAVFCAFGAAGLSRVAEAEEAGPEPVVEPAAAPDAEAAAKAFGRALAAAADSGGDGLDVGDVEIAE